MWLVRDSGPGAFAVDYDGTNRRRGPNALIGRERPLGYKRGGPAVIDCGELGAIGRGGSC